MYPKTEKHAHISRNVYPKSHFRVHVIRDVYPNPYNKDHIFNEENTEEEQFLATSRGMGCKYYIEARICLVNMMS